MTPQLASFDFFLVRIISLNRQRQCNFLICLITTLTSAKIVALELFRLKQRPQLHLEQCLSPK